MRADNHRIRVTKLLIRQALLELLRERPLQQLTVRELCETAGISRGTFYSHYDDLYDLMRQVQGEKMEAFGSALKPLLSYEEASSSVVYDALRTLFYFFRDNAELCAITLGPYGDRSFGRQLLELGRDGIVANYARSFPNASRRQIEFYYAFVSSGCVGLLVRWIEEDMAGSPEELATMAQQILQGGIAFLEDRQS